MKNKIVRITGFLFAVLLSVNLTAQERIIHGNITTFDSIALIGAEVKVLSTKQVVITDSLGKFSVGVQMEDKLRVAARGFYTQKVEVGENIKYVAVDLKMKQGEKNREYAIGYGHVNDRDKLNALSSLNDNDMDFSQYSTIFELIQGRFAGVQIVNGEIIIRGVNSINSSSAALIVLDGIPVDYSVLATVPPIQVKSISVIKDGSAAIYGSRGSNGVLLIETKRGERTN